MHVEEVQGKKRFREKKRRGKTSWKRKDARGRSPRREET